MVRTRRTRSNLQQQEHQQRSNNFEIPFLERVIYRRNQCSTKMINITAMTQYKRWSMLTTIASLVVLLLIYVLGSDRNSTKTVEYEIIKKPEIQEKPIELPDLDNCSVGPATVTESVDGNTQKPFWVPSYPASDNGLFSALVIGLTGNVGSNAKNYYASSPTLKKCFNTKGYTMTITCQQLHPIVGIGPLPENQSHKFQSKIIMPIRNPMTCAPEHYQQKAYMYHNAQGQVSIDSWRAYRDEWFEQTIMSGWKSVITTWKDMKEYQGIGLYVPFEQLLDVDRGPILVNQLATTLRNAGFPVVSSDDTKCVWYKIIKNHIQTAIDESINRKMSPQQIIQYPFAMDYIPQYTQHQKEYMITEINALINMYPDDTDLILILKEYIQQIQQSTINDILASTSNTTTH